MPKKIPVKLVITGVDRVSKVMRKITQAFPKLSKQVRRTSTVFGIMQKKTEKFRRSMKRLGSGMRTFGRGMTIGLTAPIGLAGGAIIRTAVDFQRSINRVGALTRTIIGGKVSKDFLKLEQLALDLGASTEFSANQVANALAVMGQQGTKTGDILSKGFVGDILALASATGTELPFAIDVAGKTMKQFGLQASDMTRITDVLALTTASTNTTMESIAETFKVAGPIAKAYGATLEQTAAITGLLGDVGIQGSLAGTALKNIFIKLATPSKRATELMKAMNVEAFDPLTKSMKSVGEILTLIGPKIGKLNKNKQLEVLNELFGLRGIAGASALMEKAMRDGKDPVAAMTKTLENATGVARDMQTTMLRGSVGALARFQSAFEGAGLAIAKSGLLDAFTDILTMLAGMFSSLSKLSPVILKWGTIMVGIVAALGPAIIFVGFLVSAIGTLITAFTAISAVIGGFKIAALGAIVVGKVMAVKMLVIAVVGKTLALVMGGMAIAGKVLTAVFLFMTSPIGLIVLGVALLVAGVVRAIAIWDDLIASFKAGQGVFDTISKVFKTFFGVGDEEKKIIIEKKITTTAKGQFGPAKGAAVVQANFAPVRSEAIVSGAIGINFGNVPQGTRIRSESSGPVGLDLGISGAAQ